MNKWFKVVVRVSLAHCDVRMRDTISPYSANASPKMRIKIMPTKILSCCALARTPASPTIPMAKPAA